MKPEIIGKGGLKRKPSRDAYTEVNVRYGIAFQLRAMREARGWSQAELAKMAKTTPSTISRLEAGWHTPSVTTLIRLAKVFDVCLHVRFMSFTDYRRATRDKRPAALNVTSYGQRTGTGREDADPT